MRRTVLLLVVAAAACVAFAPAPLPRRDRHKEDPNALYGNWEFVMWEMNGQKSNFSQYLELTPEKVDFVSIVGNSRVTYKFVTRPEMTPRAFHWQPDHAGGWFGSYRIRNGELTLIFKSGGSWQDRPTDFKGRHEYRFILRKKS